MDVEVNAPRLAGDFEVVEGVREVRDNLANAIDKSVARRPYTTLLLAVGLGFLLGAVWTR